MSTEALQLPGADTPAMPAPPAPPPAESEAMDALLDNWLDHTEGKSKWGGRGKGGRGVARRYQCMSVACRDVLVETLSLAYAGKELLSNATLRLVQGRRYALLGKNGAGKSTLLQRAASGMLPGFPPHLRVAVVAQEDRREIPQNDSILGWLVSSTSASTRERLEGEQEELESALDLLPADDPSAAVLSERLGDIDTHLESLTDGAARQAAEKMLLGLGFSAAKMAAIPPPALSGGWRMRVTIASALMSSPDVLFLDEPTNHLDLHGVLWLEALLAGGGGGGIVVVVSHDEEFLKGVATDVIVMQGGGLHAFPGGLEEYEKREGEKAARNDAMLDARVRQEKKARDAAAEMKKQAMSSKGGRNDGQLKQAKQKLDKISRVGLYREDGKAFKLNSLSKMDEKAMRLPSRVSAQRGGREETMQFPDPDVSSLRLVDGAPLISVLDASVGYTMGGVLKSVLHNVNLQLTAKSRVAVVGDNGAGKTTLLRLLGGELQPIKGKGMVRTPPGLRVASVGQHHSEGLAEHGACAFSVKELVGVLEAGGG